MAKRKNGLAICMAAMLAISGMTVAAAEPLQAAGENAAENVAAVSGGNADTGVETPDGMNSIGEENPDNIVMDNNMEEIVVEDQIMAYAADNIASGVDGDITWVIDSSGKLIVNGTGNLGVDTTFVVNYDGSYDAYLCGAWGPYREQIMSAEINVQGMTDASYLFAGCKGLTNLDVRGFDTRNVASMECMFLGCSSLTSLDVSGFDTGNVTNMSWMFYNCSGLTSVDVSGFDTSSVTNMYGMFLGCSGLTSVDVSGFDTSSVTNMSHMFYGCSGLTSVDVSGFDTSSVTNMYYMFYNCSGLTSVDVCGFDTSSVTDMSGMFFGCSGLTSVDVSGFDTSSVTYMNNMLWDCSGLTSVDVSGFDTSSVTNMYYMFYNCSGLTSVDVSGFDTSSVTDMNGMFFGCSGLTSVDVSGFDTSNVTYMNNMFLDCSGLTSVDVSGFDTSSVTTMSRMFSGCSGLTSVDVSGFDTSSVADMHYMFSGCSGLTSVDVSGFDTSSVTDMNGMFLGCSGLTSVDVSGFDTSSVTYMGYMGYMFYGCSSLTTIQSPYNVNVIAPLPSVPGTVWTLPDGTEVTELPQGLSYSVTLTRNGTPTTPEIITTTPDLNMDNVVRIKYVPYSYTVETSNTDPDNTVTFSIVEGELAEGLQMYPATGEIYGVPLEAGEFRIKVMATYSDPAYLPSYAELLLTVLDNTDGNVGVATDPGYEITQPVVNFNMDTVSGEGTQTLVSQGEYAQFQHAVYIDGRKLTEGQEYTSEAGSTRITILNQTLTGSGTGTHTLGVEFRTEDGSLKRAAQNYTVSSGSTEENPPKDEGGNETPPADDGDGDNNTPVTPPTNNENNDNNSNNNNANNSDTANITPAAEPQQDFLLYKVERGDSLWKIAVKFYGQGSSWRRIYEDNAAVIKNPGRLYAGQILIIRLNTPVSLPVETPVPVSGEAVLEETSYRVQRGDRLWTIARRVYGSGSLWTVIYEANRDIIADPERIREGQVIAIPQR